MDLSKKSVLELNEDEMKNLIGLKFSNTPVSGSEVKNIFKFLFLLFLGDY